MVKDSDEAESLPLYRRLFDIARDGMLILDGPTGEILDVNPKLITMLGCSTEEFLGKKPWQVDCLANFLSNPSDFLKLQDQKERLPQNFTLTTRGRHPVQVELVSHEFRSDGKELILCNLRDISAQKQVEALQAAIYRIAIATETTTSLNDLYGQIHEIISGVMPAENFYITIYNEERNVLQFPYFKDSMDEPYLSEIEPGKGLTAYVLRTGKSLLCTQAVHDELERKGAVILLGEPSTIWLGVPLIIAGKTIGAMVVQHYSDPDAYSEREQHMLEFVSSQVAVAISRKQVEEALRESERRLQNAERVANLGSWEMDIISGKTVWSDELFRLAGLEPNAFEPTAELGLGFIHPEDRERVSQTLDQAIAGKSTYAIEARIVRPDGSELWMDARGEVICDESGKPIKLVGSFLDITARKQADEALRQLSIHDILTGLYNRGFFEEELTRLERGRGYPISVIMADVDNLKETNDREGHAAGDALLKRVAKVLRAALRSEDLVARIGGDEFAILLPGTDKAAVNSVLSRIQQILDENNTGQPGNSLQLSFGASTGEKGSPLAEVLKEADVRMYAEKQKHNGLRDVHP